ncbi:unnamed protein product, partial [marine sediment metagenome]
MTVGATAPQRCPDILDDSLPDTQAGRYRDFRDR